MGICVRVTGFPRTNARVSDAFVCAVRGARGSSTKAKQAIVLQDGGDVAW